MAGSIFLQPVIHVLNLMTQMNRFELKKDMHALGQNSLFIYITIMPNYLYRTV